MRPSALLIAALSFLSIPILATVPAGFTDVSIATVGGPTALAFTPDGRLLITQQSGSLRVYESGALVATPAITFPAAGICTDSERGLLGVAVDPAFATNSYIYLFRTVNQGTCVNRVSRFTMTGNTVSGATELVLVDNMPSTHGNHNAGDLQFGKDGYLYISIGDGGPSSAAREEHVLSAKILRITSTGGIPPTNPFQGAGTARCNVTGSTTAGNRCQETFAWGLRNPFRIAFDPNAASTRFFINDVGQNTWEEIDLGQSGVDYGWNCREGAHTFSTTGACSPTPPGMVDPIFEYSHGANVPGTSVGGCGSITGGAFVPNGVWPGYDNAFLFSDFNCGAIFAYTSGSTASTFATSLGGAVHLVFGPFGSSQALYYTSYVSGGQVHRISLNNTPPTPAITSPAAGTLFAVGQNFTLTGSATDAEQGTLPASSLSWTMLVHHANHTHSFLGPTSGNNVPFTAPAPEDLLAATNSYLEIQLTATDSGGLSSTVTRNLDPRKVTLTFNTDPNSMSVRVNGVDFDAPAQVVSWDNWQFPISAFDQMLFGASYVFASWSDGGAQTHNIVTPSTAASFLARFTPTTGTDFFTVTPCRLVDTRNGGPPLSNASRTFVLTQQCGIPITASALALNITVVGPSTDGLLIVYPGGTLLPSNSTINFRAGQTRANNAIIPLGDLGDVTVSPFMAGTGGAVHLVLDVVGWFE